MTAGADTAGFANFYSHFVVSLSDDFESARSLLIFLLWCLRSQKMIQYPILEMQELLYTLIFNWSVATFASEGPWSACGMHANSWRLLSLFQLSTGASTFDGRMWLAPVGIVWGCQRPCYRYT